MPATPTVTATHKRQQDAAKWLARLERGLVASEGREFAEWLKDAGSREIILDSASLWHSADVQAVLCTMLGVAPQRTRPTQSKRSLALPLTVALGSTLGLLVILWSGHMPWASAQGSGPSQPQASSTVYTTAVGDTKLVTLADGSTITLNTGTRVSVSFSPRGREANLLRGEATFVVSPSPGLPAFSVTAGRRRFQAQGSRFNLRTLARDNVELTVAAGQVTLLDAPARLPDTPARRRDVITYGEQTVSAFEEALVEPGFQSVSHIEAGEVEARLAWQQGLIVFEDKALPDALAEVERYTLAKFVLADAQLNALRVSGRFRTGNVNAVRLTLRQKFLVASKRDTRGRIVLSAIRPI
jgi:transmembrane sensor